MDPSAAEPAAIVRALIAALNRGDIGAALSFCADDIVLWSPGQDLAGQHIEGKDQLRQHLEFTEASWPGLWASIDSIVASGERVAVELTIVASQEATVLVQPIAAFYTVRAGLVVEQRSYFDLGALERQLAG